MEILQKLFHFQQQPQDFHFPAAGFPELKFQLCISLQGNLQKVRHHVHAVPLVLAQPAQSFKLHLYPHPFNIKLHLCALQSHPRFPVKNCRNTITIAQHTVVYYIEMIL